MVLVVFNLNTRDRSPGSGSHFLHTATQFLRSVTQSLRGLLRRHSVYCFGLLAGLALSACGGCAAPKRPIGIVCQSVSQARSQNASRERQGMFQGQTEGAQMTNITCRLLYDDDTQEQPDR